MLLMPTPPGHAHFLQPLQQAVVERAVGVDLALQDVVLDAAILQVEDVLLRPLQPGQDRGFLLDGGAVDTLDRAAHDLGLLLDLAVQFLDAGSKLLHLRKGGLVDPQLILVLRLQLGALLLQRLDGLVVDHLRRGLGVGVELLVLRLGLGAILLGARRREVELVHRLGEDVLLVVDGDDLLAALELHQRALGVLEPGLGLRELLLEEGLRVPRGVVTALEVDVDEVLRQRVQDLGGEATVRRLERDLDQP